jgi:hypothetical protein
MSFIIQNLWFIIIGVFVILVGGSLFLFYTGYWHRIMDWLKPNSDRFVADKMFCEDKEIRDRKLTVGRYVASDMKKHRSFYLVHSLLLSGPSGGGKFLATTERSARPIDFHNRLTAEDWKKYPSAQRVFIDTTADIRSSASRESANSFVAQSLAIMAICATIIVIIFGIIVFWQNRSGIEGSLWGLLNYV